MTFKHKTIEHSTSIQHSFNFIKIARTIKMTLRIGMDREQLEQLK